MVKINQTLLRQFSLTSISSVFFSVIQILIQVFVVRSVSQADFGILTFTFGLYNVIELLFTGYSSDLSMQNIGKNSTEVSLENINIGILIKHDIKVYTYAIFSGLILGFILALNNNFSMPVWIVLLLGLFCQIGYAAIKNTLISYNLIEIQTKYELKCMLLLLVLNVIFTYAYGIIGYVISMMIYYIGKNILGFFVLNNLGLNFNKVLLQIKSEEKVILVKQKHFSLFSGARNGLINLYNQFDIIILGFIFSNPATLAQYKVAKTLSGIPAKIVYPIWSALRGRIVNAYYSNNIQRLVLLIFKPMCVFFVFFLFVFIICYYFSPFVVPLIYGDKYISSINIFLILLSGTLVLQLTNNWFSFWIIIANKNKAYIYILLIQIMILSSFFIFNYKGGINNFAIYVAASLAIGGVLQMAFFYLNYRTHIDKEITSRFNSYF